MNSLINRLNPKNCSLEPAIGSGSIHAVTASDVAAALSFSQMPQISHDLIRAKCLNENSTDQLRMIANALTMQYGVKQRPDLISNCALVALIEFCKVPPDYKPSGRNRAALLGVASTTYRRKGYDFVIDDFAALINDYYAIGRAKLGRQFASLRNSASLNG